MSSETHKGNGCGLRVGAEGGRSRRAHWGLVGGADANGEEWELCGDRCQGVAQLVAPTERWDGKDDARGGPQFGVRGDGEPAAGLFRGLRWRGGSAENVGNTASVLRRTTTHLTASQSNAAFRPTAASGSDLYHRPSAPPLRTCAGLSSVPVQCNSRCLGLGLQSPEPRCTWPPHRHVPSPRLRFLRY
jgi:hypothetical protein